MKRQHHTITAQRSRRDSHVGVRGAGASVAAVPSMGVVVMQGQLFTAKINPCWASGGLPREGNT